MNENKAVPNIRFKSFENYWVKIKVSNLGNKFTGGGTPSKKNKSYWSGSIPWFQSSDLILNNVLKISIKKRITYKAIDESSTKLVSKDSIAIVTRVGVGKLVLIPYKYTTSQDFISISEIIYNKKFVLYLLYYVLNYSRRLGTKQGTSIKGITKNYFLTTEVVLPKNSFEQQKIGDFFTKLDKLLDLQQQKIDKLELLKKALLQTLFPKHDAKIPELRFQGFNKNWLKNNIMEIAPLRSGFAFQGFKFKEKGVPIIRISNILTEGKTGGEYVYYDEMKNDIEYTLKNGDCIIAMSGATTGKSALVKGTCEKYYQNQRVGMFQHKNNFSYKFVTQLIKSNLFLRQMDRVLVQGAQPNISSKEIDSFTFSIPSMYEEQQKIGNLLSKVDQLIELENKKLQNFQQVKKCLLQNMFVE
ncbi:restriction endonuclease subunit S [Lactobacillus laiwuensis]|uniref:restriction endonuclease subunit S n=1 Tax=Lactobacillus laiwuensis TaxID=2841034 RepID=UPI001CC63909|nr:restriction endonuclease subunit S [Lactobacillus laiwuensis]